MLLTEEEAKKKECPLNGFSHCIASDCMMWMFIDRQEAAYNCPHCKTCLYVDGMGYCGLGGN